MHAAGVEIDFETGNNEESMLTLVLVTDNQSVDWLPPSDKQNIVFQKIFDVFTPITVRKISNVPINEFTENDRLILGSFPHLFILGCGVPKSSSSSKKLHSHYLNQFTGAMAKSSSFVFLLSNQLRRNATQSVSLRVKNTPETFGKFGNLVKSTTFKRKVKRAMKNPDGSDAHGVLKAIDPYIQMYGKDVPYRPME